VGAGDGGDAVTGEHPSLVWAREFIDELVAVTRGQRVDKRYYTPEQWEAIETLTIRLMFLHSRSRPRNSAPTDARGPDPDVILGLWRNRVLDAGTGDLVDALAEAIRQRDEARWALDVYRAHEWVVRGFADLTEKSMHDVWGRIQ
jgi:hypothetical protein